MVETHTERRERLYEEAQRALKAEEDRLRALLEMPGGIEGLVTAGRPPIFVEAQQGNSGRVDEIVLCFLPPDGVRRGDQADWRGYNYHFYSPEGTDRGAATLIALTPQEAKPLQERVAAQLAALR